MVPNKPYKQTVSEIWRVGYSQLQKLTWRGGILLIVWNNRGKNQFYSCQFSGKRQSICRGCSCGDIFSTQFIFPRVIFGMVYLLSFLSLLQIIQFCLDASRLWNLCKLNGGSVHSRMKSNTTPSGFCWCFHIPCIWAFFPPGEIHQNHSSNIINNIPASLPHATAAFFQGKATHPKKTPRVKIDREILNSREIFRVNAATPWKNMNPVCSGGLLW